MKICIDAGHGGSEPGAIGPGNIKEKDITLKIAKLAGELAKINGFEVVYTRISDKFLSLRDRAEIANRNDCDIFISIHCNAFKKESQGTETYGFPGSEEGKNLGLEIHHEMLKATKLANRGYKTARFGVLRMTSMPAVLVETAFISNSKEEKLLLSYEFQKKVACAIIKGAAKYLSKKYPGRDINTDIHYKDNGYNDNIYDGNEEVILKLQKFLNSINITDYEGKMLVEDGIFGKRTKSAFEKLSKLIDSYELI